MSETVRIKTIAAPLILGLIVHFAGSVWTLAELVNKQRENARLILMNVEELERRQDKVYMIGFLEERMNKLEKRLERLEWMNHERDRLSSGDR